LALSSLARALVVYDIHEYYELALLMRQWLPSPLKMITAYSWRKLEDLFNSKYSGLIVVNHHMAEQYSRVNHSVCVLHNWPLEEYFAQERPLDQGSLTAIEELAGFNVVVYTGAMNEDRGLRRFTSEAITLFHHESTFKALLIGSINGPSKDLAEFNRACEVGAIRWIPKANFVDIPQFLSVCKIGWIPWSNTEHHQLALPNKLFEYMAAGVPIVCPDLTFISSIVEDAQCGIVVPANDNAAHRKAIQLLLESPSERFRLGENGRRAFLEKYNWELEVPRLLAFYNQLLCRR